MRLKRASRDAGPARSAHPATRVEPPRLARFDLGVIAALVGLVAAIYAPAARNAFVRLDDDVYVFENPHVAGGFSRDGVRWAFTSFHASNWHPLTWLSHMLDGQLFGVAPAAAGAHHLVSVALHAANAVLLFLALRRMTAAAWPCAWVAVLFAVHPLRVESVAWASERKDVLSGLFFMLTLLAYARYAARPSAGRYAAVASSALLGMLAKPMLVTLPFVLLLLDHWPLGRRHGSRPAVPERGCATAARPESISIWRLLLEKAPLVAIAGIVSLLTIRAQEATGAVTHLETRGVAWRLVTAALGYGIYLWKTLWPTGLAPMYLHPASFLGADFGRLARVAAATAAFLAAVTAWVWRRSRSSPYALTGWLWYLGMLVPVIGLVQVGAQLWADRYAYLPLVGVYLMVVWGAWEATASRPRARRTVAVLGGACALTLAVAAHAQVRIWRDSRTLFEHTLAVTHDNWIIENNLGAYLSVEHPASDEALRHLQAAVRINPEYPEARNNLADVWLARGVYGEARTQWEQSLRLRPDQTKPRVGLANIAAREGLIDEARSRLEETLRRDPRSSEAHATLGLVFAMSGDVERARAQMEEAVSIDSGSVMAQHLLARLLATAADPAQRDPRRAIVLAHRAAERSDYRLPEVLATLAAAHASAGEFDQAVKWQSRALEICAESERGRYRERLERYRSGRALVP